MSEIEILIKKNLNNLGIKHDNFIYESDLIKEKLVSKEEFLSKNRLITFTLDDNTSVLLKVPLTSRRANLVPENTFPIILPVAPVTL